MVGVFTVVEENTSLRKYKEITGNIRNKEYESQVEGEACDDVLLFFSFDIVNSSIYKTINYFGWSIVIDHILTKIREDVKVHISRAEVWRIFGDEVVFIVKVCDRDSIYEYMDTIYSLLTYYCNIIKNGKIFEGIRCFTDVVIDLMKLQDIISLQSCAWLAVVTDRKKLLDKESPKYVENVFEVIEENQNNKFYEFIGIDIDTGFRLAKQTRSGRLTVSFELAYILAEQKEYAKKLKIITYRNLKGVWNNLVYPIIWYYDPSQHNNRSFRSSMAFDSIERDEIYKEYFGEKRFDESMYSIVKGALNKICTDRNLHDKIQNIENLIDKSSSTYTQYINNSLLELHCVAVCFDQEGRILLVKRCDKKIFPGKWEFGCAKANYSSELVETIESEYKKDFNIQIKIYTDTNREDEQPMPLAVYTINKEERLHKGIIFLADIIGGEIQLNERKHQEYKFISESEYDKLRKEDLVSDAIDTMDKAFKLRRKIKNESETGIL